MNSAHGGLSRAPRWPTQRAFQAAALCSIAPRGSPPALGALLQVNELFLGRHIDVVDALAGHAQDASPGVPNPDDFAFWIVHVRSPKHHPERESTLHDLPFRGILSLVSMVTPGPSRFHRVDRTSRLTLRPAEETV